MRVNWTEFDEPGFKDGVAGPFFKYINWMGALFCPRPTCMAYKYYIEGIGGEQRDVKSTASTTAVQAPLVTLPATISTPQQPVRFNKRPFVSASSSEDEDDVDMEMEDNDSSGPSMDEGQIPAKRLRTSTITTRSSRTTPASEEPVAEADFRHRSPSPDHNDLDIPDTTTANETGPESKGVNNSPAPSTDVDEPAANSGVSDPTRVGVRRVRELINASANPSHPSSPSPPPESDSEREIPDFLVGKNNVYGYLSDINETGFRKLLKTYITFELTVKVSDPSHLRGMLTTARRPNVVGWWSSRARPNRDPPYDSLHSLAKSIVEWWIFIQPPWRKIQPCETARNGGDWERLYQPGINGLLNVVILAYWWAKISMERGSDVNDTYSWFVSDVTWVLSQLTGVARAGGF